MRKETERRKHNERKISKSSNWEEGRLPKKEKARKSIE
jgi:hypothetical protein